MNSILRIFKDTDMRNQHDGLYKIASSKSVKLNNLSQGEHVIFLNKKLDKVKMYSSKGVLSYVRNEGRRINLGVIEMIPQCFEADNKLNWNKAEKLALEKQLEKLNRNKSVKNVQRQREASL